MSARDIVLGIDTSNYTTSLCIADTDGNIIKNIKVPLPVKEGEAGLRQSDAVFFHTKNLPEAFGKAGSIMAGCRICAVGTSDRPRDAQGSYMPCFLSGVAAAVAVSSSVGVPMFRNSHQAGHIRAAMYSSHMQNEYKGGKFISFHVSGGTTEMLLCEKTGDKISAEIIGETKDLNAGQAVDRCGVMLGMSFPCGKEIENAALEYYKTNPAIGGFGVSVRGFDCCLSGLQNLCEKKYRESADAGYTSAFVLEYIAKTLIKMTDAAYEKYGDIPLLYAGGVMSNSIIKQRIAKRYPRAYFAQPEFSSDNAAGTALLALESYLSGKETEM